MAITNERIKYSDKLSYQLFEDGYDIYNTEVDGTWISQRAPYNKVYKADGSDEENALLQLEELTKIPEEPIDVEAREVE